MFNVRRWSLIQANYPENGRLPDASQGAQHLRDVFYRMGFDDQEIVILSGAHTLGKGLGFVIGGVSVSC